MSTKSTPGPTHRKGEVWETASRKGLLVVQLEEDVDNTTDDFFQATIIEGRAKYLSNQNRLLQKAYGQGTRGDTISMRTTLTEFIKRRFDFEEAIKHARNDWRNAAITKADEAREP